MSAPSFKLGSSKVFLTCIQGIQGTDVHQVCLAGDPLSEVYVDAASSAVFPLVYGCSARGIVLEETGNSWTNMLHIL